MPAFRFKLDGVLRQRRRVEQERQRELAMAQTQLATLQTDLRRLDQTAREATDDLRQNHLKGHIDLGYLLAHRRFIAALQRQAFQIVQRMALVQRLIDQRRKALVDATVQRKVIEKLRERAFQRWLEDQNRREVAQLDEIGTQQRYRAMAGLDEHPQESPGES